MTQQIFDPKLLNKSVAGKARIKRVRRWIAALKSGRYKQGQRFLRLVSPDRPRDDKWCCLGIMLDLEQPKGWIDLATLRRDSADWNECPHKSGAPDGAIEKATMPNMATCRRYGFAVAIYGESSGAQILADMNDSGRSFKQIATRLDKSLKEALKS